MLRSNRANLPPCRTVLNTHPFFLYGLVRLRSKRIQAYFFYTGLQNLSALFTSKCIFYKNPYLFAEEIHRGRQRTGLQFIMRVPLYFYRKEGFLCRILCRNLKRLSDPSLKARP